MLPVGKPPDNMVFHFISPCEAKLYEVFDKPKNPQLQSSCGF